MTNKDQEIIKLKEELIVEILRFFAENIICLDDCVFESSYSLNELFDDIKFFYKEIIGNLLKYEISNLKGLDCFIEKTSMLIDKIYYTKNELEKEKILQLIEYSKETFIPNEEKEILNSDWNRLGYKRPEKQEQSKLYVDGYKIYDVVKFFLREISLNTKFSMY